MYCRSGANFNGSTDNYSDHDVMLYPSKYTVLELILMDKALHHDHYNYQ